MSVVEVYKDAYRVTKSKFFFPPEQFDLTSEEPQRRKWSKPSVNQTQAISKRWISTAA